MITEDPLIFSVMDYYHVEGLRCLLRYITDPEGDRELDGVRYRKVDFDEGYQILRKMKPGYVRDVHVVPRGDVVRHLQPPSRIPYLVEHNPRVRAIVDVLDHAGVPRGDMGVTGSLLLGLEAESSDVDFVAYGKNWFRARDAISEAKADPDSPIEEIDDAMWRRIYEKRVPDIPFEEFVMHERRKGNRGTVMGTYFDLLFIRSWDQIGPPPEKGEEMGEETICAVVTDAELAFDAPSIYKVDHPVVDRVLSYTHTYAGQALPGEEIEACGVLERVGDETNLVVGTTREAHGEWIRSITLLKDVGLL